MFPRPRPLGSVLLLLLLLLSLRSLRSASSAEASSASSAESRGSDHTDPESDAAGPPYDDDDDDDDDADDDAYYDLPPFAFGWEEEEERERRRRPSGRRGDDDHSGTDDGDGGGGRGPPPVLPFGFDTVFGDNMALQRGPGRASVYGFLGPSGCCKSASVSVYSVDDGGDGTLLYDVTAEINTTKQPFGPSWGVRPCLKADCPPYDMMPFNPWNEPLPAWKALLRPAEPGGNYTIVARCDDAGTCPPDVPTSSSIVNVTFGDVWYCAGQSNMWLPVDHTFSRNDTVEAIKGGRYGNVRLMAGTSSNLPRGPRGDRFVGYGQAGGTNPWMTARQAVEDGAPDGPTYGLFKFGASCWYFGQRLSELGVAVPIGLVNTAIGGQRIEEFMDNATISECSQRMGEDGRYWDGQLYGAMVLPFVDMTLAGWVWYQGENNMGGVKGSSEAGVGYGCEIRELVRGWRRVWSDTPGTTSPTAPFGVVTLASSGSEGQSGMGPMRQAQTANYGVLPNDLLPNTFLAQAYDLDDEWGPALGPCFSDWSCCDYKGSKYDPLKCDSTKRKKCTNACDAAAGTPVAMGGIHPRSKKRVGDRLGDAAYNTAYGGRGAFTGPTLAGCEVDNASSVMTVYFDTDLLRGDKIRLNPFYPAQPPEGRQHVISGGTQLFVQTNSSHFCVEPRPSAVSGELICPTWAGGSGEPTRDGLDDGWIMLNYTLASRSSVAVDLTPLNGTAPTAVRYAWGIVDCCDHTDPDLYVTHGCIASCPIVGDDSDLPANPFVAKIKDGMCACVPPQDCSLKRGKRDGGVAGYYYLRGTELDLSAEQL